MRNIGSGIRRTRCESGMTQEMLAKKTGVGRSLISKIETGESDGSLQTIKKIAHALGVTVNDLLDDESFSNKSNNTAYTKLVV
jgi:transcriptional regulator with XRE-family HTH domain